MEKQKLNNKIEDNELLEKLNIGMVNLSETIDSVSSYLDKTIKDNTTEKQQALFTAFHNKYANHIRKGENKEAEILKEAFKKQMTSE